VWCIAVRWTHVLSNLYRLKFTYTTTVQRQVFSWRHYQPYLPRILYKLKVK